ncbi:MAG TPA: DJ-1/PfpI family protein [Herminiimonas sp.]|nr:DJ-1/PfpI family protein [Herminiimonas sp.]
MTLNVGIFVFDDVEVLDFAGPYEVFTTAARVYARAFPAEKAAYNVFTIAQSDGPVRARAGLVVSPDHDFIDHPKIDVLIVPGGVVTAELSKADVIKWIATTSALAELTASVCTGAFLLAQAGLLHGLNATTHWEDLDDLRTMFPSLMVQPNVRWVDEGKLITSAGISAGIDMSLHIVEETMSRDWALKTARQMDFDWTENH